MRVKFLLNLNFTLMNVLAFKSVKKLSQQCTINHKNSTKFKIIKELPTFLNISFFILLFCLLHKKD